MKTWGQAAVLAAVLTAAPTQTAVHAQAAGQDQQMLDELRKIRQLLQLIEQMIAQQGAPARPVPGPVDDRAPLGSISVTGFSLGHADAPLTMVEFTDLQCPFCGRFYATVFEQIKKEYIETGKLRYVSRDFPLETIHPFALTAARASRCAGDQGKFWEMRHTILANNSHLTADTFATLAQDLRLDAAAFSTCVADSTKFGAEIQKDLAEGTAAGVTGTPSFVIGRSGATGMTGGIRLVGAQPYSVFEGKFKELLTEKPTTNP
jgi:protein-disulfide isomerase